ncbi:DUF4392 domain-containing protein [Propionivibrio sp.]|uniref:DUF4392 domain-containing protein n=1 Tax=Propionivibrio sp. TaxID=2212460 RepID=UPI0026315FCB|nr:DUF4392 domain-containing protein [Propionivibrio sp.]
MNESSLMTQAIARIEALARRDPGSRGLASFADTRHLLPAAAELLRGERVIVVTGFCIRAEMIGETDGPPGALAIADALRQLGKEVVLVTDKYSACLLSAGATVFGTPFPTLTLSLPQDVAERQIEELLATFAPSQVVAIERPGRAADGHCYSMRGEILDDLVPAADRLLASPSAYRSIAIGDGGNELGFGSLRESLKGRVVHGELIFCSTPADYLIPAGISNWGAFALVATLSLLAGRLLLRAPEHEYAVLQALLAAGAVDGCTKKNELSVDGLCWADYARTIADIYQETLSALETIATP